MVPQLIPAGADVTVPVPVPVFVTASVLGLRVKLAETVVAIETVTVQVSAVPEQAPPQPVKVEPDASAAVRMTEVPNTKGAVQVAPHERPVGAEVTVPLPVPFFVMVSGAVVRVKAAVTVVSPITVTAQGPVPWQEATFHPAKVERLSATAVSVTVVPRGTRIEHVAPHAMPVGAEVMVPPPLPPRMTLKAYSTGANVAVTLMAAIGVKTQGPVPVHPPPLQPVKMESASGVALNVMLEPEGTFAEHVKPQSMPAGDDETTPAPVPIFVTVTETWRRSKFAVTVAAVINGTTHVVMPVHAPLQPVKTESLSGAAVRETEVPGAKSEAHVGPQVIPAGVEVMVPLPPPVRVTVNVTGVVMNVALTSFAASSVTTQVPVPEQPAPIHPVKREPVAATAVRVTDAPAANEAEQSPVVQSMPAGLELTRPLPVPLT